MTFIIAFIFLLLTNTFHILLLAFSWSNESIILFIHLVILVLFLSFFTFAYFLTFFEKGHVELEKLKMKKLGWKNMFTYLIFGVFIDTS